MDDSDGNRFAALASQLIMTDQTRPMTLMKGGHIGSRSTTEYLSISFLDSSKTFSSVLTGFSVILGIA